MTPTSYAFFQEILLDPAKAIPNVQAICRMKARTASRKPLYQVGFTDADIDSGNAITLMMLRAGIEHGIAMGTQPLQAQGRAQARNVLAEALAEYDQVLRRAVYEMKHSGQLDEKLLTLRRLGVPYMTVDGYVRSAKDVVHDAAARFDQQPNIPQGEHQQIAIGMGMPAELAAVVAAGSVALEKALAGGARK
jgi:hypothetical protein